MHKIENTDLNNIKHNVELRQLEQQENNCVLIITGSLNPIHRSHIKNLQLVQQYLEHHKTQPLNVVGAYISPTHDFYVRPKLGDVDWISAENRCELCEEAIKEEKLDTFISVTKGELQESRFVDFDEVTISLADFLNSELLGTDKLLRHPIKVVYVCGLDHFNKCPHVENLSKCQNIACAVIYRPGANEDQIKKLVKQSSSIYYISLDDERETLRDMSSTEIRERYRNPTDTDSDETTYACVRQFLQEKYHKK